MSADKTGEALVQAQAIQKEMQRFRDHLVQALETVDDAELRILCGNILDVIRSADKALLDYAHKSRRFWHSPFA